MNVFKENRQFWIYVLGIIILFIILFAAMSRFLGNGNFLGLGGTTEQRPPVNYTFDTPPTYRLNTDRDYRAEINTNYGRIVVDLYEKNAPNNVNNFVFLSQTGYYDGVKVHRMIQDLLIQTGSRTTLNDNPEDDDGGNPGYVVVDEINWDSLDLSESKRKELQSDGFATNTNVSSKKIRKYTLAMANADKPNSTGSQFFIITGDDADPRVEYLNGRHTAIGTVIEGRDVVDNIRRIQIDESNPLQPRPIEDIIIESVKIIIN